MSKWKSLLQITSSVLTSSWLWGIGCLVAATALLLTPSDQFGKFTAFLLGANLSAAVYNFLIQKMRNGHKELAKLIDDQQRMIEALMRSNAQQIGQVIVDRLNSIRNLETTTVTKH